MRLLSEGLDYKKSVDMNRWEAERNDVMSTFGVALLLTTSDGFHFWNLLYLLQLDQQFLVVSNVSSEQEFMAYSSGQFI